MEYLHIFRRTPDMYENSRNILKQLSSVHGNHMGTQEIVKYNTTYIKV
jgi:hypothetical protein